MVETIIIERSIIKKIMKSFFPGFQKVEYPVNAKQIQAHYWIQFYSSPNYDMINLEGVGRAAIDDAKTMIMFWRWRICIIIKA